MSGLREEDKLTLLEHLSDHMQSNGLPFDSDLVREIAARFQVDHLLPMPIVTLSNGQTRRARVLRALLSKPEVLILEEPFS